MEAWLIALIVILCMILPIVFLKLYIITTTGWNHSPVCLVGKTAIVTGSNIGIGFYTALEFAKRGARVILACRNASKAEEAKAKIIEATGNKNIVVKIIDLSSLSSVRQFAKDINESEDRLDILVNNAGAGFFEHSYTDDDLSLSMQINHFGPFLLTILLIGLLKKSAPSRIVIVSSSAAGFGKLNMNNLNAPSRVFTKIYDYANSKLCNLLFTTELAHKLEGTGVTVNAIHPGAVQSDFLKDTPNLLTKFVSVPMKLLYKSTEAGAQTSIYVAIAKELNGISGKYFVDCADTKLPGVAQDKVQAKMLWDKCEELVKLTADEKRHLSGSTIKT